MSFASWLFLATSISAVLIGYFVGRIHAYLENARYLKQLDRWVDKQSRKLPETEVDQLRREGRL